MSLKTTFVCSPI